MSDTNRTAIRIKKESTPGTVATGNYQDIRFTSANIVNSVTTQESGEIDNTRNISDVTVVDSEPGGDIAFELSYDTLDANGESLLEAAMFNSWSTLVAVSEADISASAVDNSLNTIVGDFTLENIIVGQWLDIRGFVTNGTRIFGKVVSLISTKVILTGVTLVNESATTVTMAGESLRNGTNQDHFTIEEGFLDITQFLVYKGMAVNSLTLDISSAGRITGSVNFMGFGVDPLSNTSIAGAVVTAPTNKVFNTSSNVNDVQENNTSLNNKISSMTLTLENNLRGQKAVRVLGNAGIGNGQAKVTGNLELYFEDEIMYNKFLNNTDSVLSWLVRDDVGNAYMFTLPKVNYTEGQLDISGPNADTFVPLGVQGIKDPLTVCSLQIDKFAA